MPLELSYKQQGDLHRLLMKAFPNSAALDRLVKPALNCTLAEVAGNGSLQDQVAEVLTWTDAHDKFADLLITACNLNPDNNTLHNFAIAVGLAVDPVTSSPPSVAAASSADSSAPATHGGNNFYGPTTINGPTVGGDVGNLTYNATPPAAISPSTAASPSGTLTTLKRKRLQADLDLLLQQHEALAQQQRLELDSAQKVVLGQKIEALESRIEALEAQIG